MVRQAAHEDIPQMCGLLSELFSIEADFRVDSLKQARGLGLLLSNSSGTAAVFVAEKGGDIVGMCSVQTLISTSEGGRVGLVEDVVVAKEFRGQGIGSLLLEHVSDWAQLQKLRRLQLLADNENLPALAFYSGHNWKKTNLICLRKAFPFSSLLRQV